MKSLLLLIAICLLLPANGWGTTILFDGFEDGTDDNWECDYIQGDSAIVGSPVYAGSYALNQPSTSTGNLVHCFADNALLGSPTTMVEDIQFTTYLYYSSGFQWPSGAVKIWLLNSFLSWGAGCSEANNSAKPHTWAPYYFTIYANGSGQPMGQLVRADGLETNGECRTDVTDGALWVDYAQNQGSPVAISAATWTKLTVRLKLNTSGSSDGIFQLWIDDVLKADYSTMNFRGTYTDTGWNHLMSSFDPEPSHPQAQNVTRDDVLLESLDVNPSISGCTISGGTVTGVRVY